MVVESGRRTPSELDRLVQGPHSSFLALLDRTAFSQALHDLGRRPRDPSPPRSRSWARAFFFSPGPDVPVTLVPGRSFHGPLTATSRGSRVPDGEGPPFFPVPLVSLNAWTASFQVAVTAPADRFRHSGGARCHSPGLAILRWRGDLQHPPHPTPLDLLVIAAGPAFSPGGRRAGRSLPGFDSVPEPGDLDRFGCDPAFDRRRQFFFFFSRGPPLSLGSFFCPRFVSVPPSDTMSPKNGRRQPLRRTPLMRTPLMATPPSTGALCPHHPPATTGSSLPRAGRLRRPATSLVPIELGPLGDGGFPRRGFLWFFDSFFFCDPFWPLTLHCTCFLPRFPPPTGPPRPHTAIFPWTASQVRRRAPHPRPSGADSTTSRVFF